MSAAENGQGAETPRTDAVCRDEGEFRASVSGLIDFARTLERDLTAAQAALQAERESVARLKTSDEMHWRTLRECADILCLPDESPSLLPEKIRLLQACAASEKQAKIERGDMLLAAQAESESLRETNGRLRAALEACGVFTTPLEKLNGWGEYKEDAMRLRNEALALTPESVASEFAALRAEVARLTKDRDDWKAKHWKAHDDFHRQAISSVELIAERDGLRSALEGIASMPEYDQDDAHRLRHKAKTALATPPAAQTGAKEVTP